MAQKKSTAQVEIEQSTKLAGIKVTATADVIMTLTQYACIAFAFYCFKEAVHDLAGQTTVAKLVLDLAANLTANEWFAYICALGGSAYGGVRHRQWKTMCERMGPAKTAREKAIDPGRSGSKLTARGEPNPQDL